MRVGRRSQNPDLSVAPSVQERIMPGMAGSAAGAQQLCGYVGWALQVCYSPVFMFRILDCRISKRAERPLVLVPHRQSQSTAWQWEQ